MTAMQSTMDKLFEMRMTTMARAYRDLGDAPVYLIESIFRKSQTKSFGFHGESFGPV